MVTLKRCVLCLRSIIIACALICLPVEGHAQESGLKLLATLFSADAGSKALSFPEKLAVTSSGDIYVLDSELSNIFLLNKRSEALAGLCNPRLPNRASDISVDARGNIWILDSRNSKIARINRKCEIEAAFACRNNPLKMAANSFGEIVVLTGAGETLFDVYSVGGKLLRSFGERIRYADEAAEKLLRDGRIVADATGGFYFSFEYPPLIRHYSRNGRLLGEFRPDSDRKLDPPEVSIKQQGDALVVSSHYQVLVLDMAVDSRGRLYLLMSGQNKAVALNRGSKRLVVTTGRGKVLKSINLTERFHRIAAAGADLYLLKNRRELKLEKYALPH